MQPLRWYLATVTMALVALVGGLATMVLPGLMTVSLFLLALGLSALVPVVHPWIVQEKPTWRTPGELVLLGLPMLLFGAATSLWVQEGMDLIVGLAMRVTLGAVAAVSLRSRPGLIVATQWALWASLTLMEPSFLSIGSLVFAGAIAFSIGRNEQAEQTREEQLRAAQERAQSRARDILSDYEDTGQGWFWETDRRSQLTYVSETVARLLGRTADAMVGRPLVQLFDLAQTDENSERTLMFHLSTRSAFKELAVRAAIEGDDLWWSISGRPIFDSYDNFVGFRGSGTDLTERKRSQEEVSRLANFDSLTGLANRRQISRVLEKLLSAPQADKRDCAVFLLDLDRFKHVNDTMGHPAGDALLKQVAQRLERTVGKVGQVGRLGGDEFKVVIPGKHKQQMLSELAGAVIHALSQPYAIEGQRVMIGASVGIAIAPDNGNNADDLVRNADLALYAAKDGGRGRFHFYAQDLHAEAEARAQMEEELRDAITKGDLQLFYQPIVSTATEEITGFEALMRWHHPVKGWVPPDRFIGIAEDTGIIAQLGEWALRTACNDLADMPASVRVAVNVSPLQFSNPQLPAIVTHAIAQSGIQPDQLELEITESVFLSDDAGTDAMFKALKRVGVRLALDDFGTGYSSLGYLKTAPFDKIKIDQSFVRGATQEGSRNGAIIASITSLAHALGMETTAEGVETMDELDLVRLHGCSHVQGFIYDRPLDAATAKSRLASGLMAVARGPRASRAPRQTMLRKVVLEHGGHFYDGTIRNISTTGAMIEGLWNVPVGTVFSVQLSQGFAIGCTTRWSLDEKIGVEFANPLRRDESGRLIGVQGPPVKPVAADPARKAG
ncbi:EAL domain-containing protein [Alteraurantiacibacter buctensis]|uniref:EAL domain-containing protein n=1 Tax=Alteraurantiacibacter buctensis TaxID=1503981 RepID=A0A844YYK9_9SPHN|nr:EAL domain-containing protein [Alteraurantiacibacter buctensis]MXO71554.1 EAL domain-containing protein [Alteraurantiacibacter buctensis]